MPTLSDSSAGTGQVGADATVTMLRLDVASHATAVTAVDHMLDMAIRVGASDVHCEPDPDGLRIRFRIDGRLALVGRPWAHVPWAQG